MCQLPTAEARWLAAGWIVWSKIAPATIGWLTAAPFLMSREAMKSASPSIPQEMHLKWDRSGLFFLSMAWQFGHSLLVLCGSTTMMGMPASLALYSMNDLSWWKAHELRIYLLPFLTVVLILIPLRSSMAIAEEVPLASWTISLDITDNLSKKAPIVREGSMSGSFPFVSEFSGQCNKLRETIKVHPFLSPLQRKENSHSNV